MKISKLSIKSFRSIIDLQEIIFKGVTVFIGKNDAGKSNIMLALERFFNQKARPGDLNIGLKEKEGYIGVCLKKNLEKSVFLDATSTETTLVEEYLLNSEDELEVIMEIGTQKQPKTKLFLKTLDFEESDFSSLAQKNEQELNDLLKKYDLGFSGSPSSDSRRSGRERTNKERRRMLREHAESKGLERIEQKIELNEGASSGLFNEIKKIINEVSFNLYLGNTPLAISESQHQSSLRPLVDLATNSALGKISTTKRELEKVIAEELQSEIKKVGIIFFKDTGLDLQFNVSLGNLEWGRIVKPNLTVDEDEDRIPLENRGLGTQRLFVMAMFRYLCKRLPELGEEEYDHFVFAIEEPESFLHNDLQRKFFYSMLDLSSEGPQIILTTHSPVFSRINEQTCVYLITHTAENGTIAKNVNVKNDYPAIKGELGIWNNDVFFDNAFMCVEGKTEKNCFPFILQKLNCGLSELGIRLIDLESQTKVDKVKELLRFAKDHGIVTSIFLDNDPQNIKNKEDICRCPDFTELFPEDYRDALFKIWDSSFIDCFPKEILVKAIELYAGKTLDELGIREEFEDCERNIEDKLGELLFQNDNFPFKFEKAKFGEYVGKSLLEFECEEIEPLKSINEVLNYVKDNL